MAAKKSVPAQKKRRSVRNRRFRPACWGDEDTYDLNALLEPFEVEKRNQIPAEHRKAFVRHASSLLARQIKRLQAKPASDAHRRKRADLAAMTRACDRLVELWERTEARPWIVTAFMACGTTPGEPMPQVARHIRHNVCEGQICYDLKVHATVPEGREELLISIPGIFHRDLRWLSQGLRRAQALLRGTRPSKGNEILALLYDLCWLFREETGLKPSIHGPFRDVAEFAGKRLYGESPGEHIIVSQLRVLRSLEKEVWGRT